MAKRPAQRDLGWKHRQRRANMPPPRGELCPYCDKPMWPRQQLDADHVIPRSRGGAKGPLRWAHASCNRREGARLGNATRARPLGEPSRRW